MIHLVQEYGSPCIINSSFLKRGEQCLIIMPRSHIHGLDAGLATDVHSWQSVLVRSFPYCIPYHT